MDDDQRLIRETLQGSRAAFEELVRRYQQRLFRTIVHMAGNVDDAEEVVQDTFVQAYTRLASFQGRAGFYTWLYRIAHNLWVSRRRRKRPEHSVEQLREQTGTEPMDRNGPPCGALEQSEQVQLVHQALHRLADDHRVILILREIDGCDYEAIAAILELPLGTVRSRLHRARGELKRELESLM